MWVRDEIAAELGNSGVATAELSSEATSAWERELELRFAKRGAGPLWERLRDSYGFHAPEGWRRLPELVLGASILFVRDAQGACAFRFADAQDIVDTLSRCSNFEFYISNDSFSFVLAFNHHDFLIGAGDALDQLQKRFPADDASS